MKNHCDKLLGSAQAFYGHNVAIISVVAAAIRCCRSSIKGEILEKFIVTYLSGNKLRMT